MSKILIDRAVAQAAIDDPVSLPKHVELMDAVRKALAQPEPTAEAKRTLSNPPERIYLQVGDEASDWPGDIVWSEVSWCEDQVHSNDLVYVSANLAKAQRCKLCGPASQSAGEDIAEMLEHPLEQPATQQADMSEADKALLDDVVRDLSGLLGEAQPATQQLPQGFSVVEVTGSAVKAWPMTTAQIEAVGLAGEAQPATQQAEPSQFMPRNQDSCFCDSNISLQMVSGGAAREGYLGRVTLLINGQYVDYLRVQGSERSSVVEAQPQAEPAEEHPLRNAVLKKITDICQSVGMRPDEVLAQPTTQQPAEQQCNETDELLRNLGLDPEHYRTEGGYVNHRKVKAAIRNPEHYPQLGCAHEFVDAPASLGGRICKKCSRMETPKAQPPVNQQLTTEAKPATQQDYMALYEELRKIIDGGSESMTHQDAVQQLKHWESQSWTPAGEPVAYRRPSKPSDPDYDGNDWKFSETGFIDCKGEPLFTTPQPRRKMTDELIKQCLISVDPGTKRLPPGFKKFALLVIEEYERINGIGGQA